MGDESGPRRFDYERARLTLDERVFNAACPVCEENKWHRPAFGNATVFLALANLEGELLVGPNGEAVGNEAYALVCNGCGYVRLHNLSVVEWYAARMTSGGASAA